MVFTVTKNIRKYRIEKGFSQEYMANMLRISQSTYAKIENNSINLNLKRLQSISSLLEIDTLQLFYKGSSDLFNNNKIENIFKDFEKITIENSRLTEELFILKTKLIDLMDEKINVSLSNKQ